jgi:hypothetical protein
MIEPATAAMESFDARLRALKRDLDAMNEYQRMLTVVASVEQLTDFYLTVATINSEFHRPLENGEILPTVMWGTA